MEYTLEQLFNTKAIKYNNRAEQIKIYEYFVKMHPLRINNNLVTKAQINRAFKVFILRELDRFTTEEINLKYNLNISELGIWIKLHETEKQDYFAFVTEAGIYKKARIDKSKNKMLISVANDYGRASMEYEHKRLSYSSHLFDKDVDVGISVHSLVCIAYGKYDGMQIDDIAGSSINHKNRNHYDNRPCNVEVSNIRGNNIHKIVSDLLEKYGVFRSLDVEHSLIIYGWDNKQKINYINTLKKCIDSNDSEWINNEIIDELLETA